MYLLASFLLIKSDWVTAVFVLILLLLGAAKYLYKDRLSELAIVFFSKRYFLNFGKESQLIFSNFNKILFAVQTLVLALFIFLLTQFYFVAYSEENQLYLFLKIVIGISLYLSTRYAIGKILGVLFSLNRMQSRLAFSKTIYLYSISIIILPFILLTFYVKSLNLMMFQLTGLILCILLIVRYVFILKNNKSLLKNELFYFIVYLCALEMAPVLVVFKIIN
jgi:hypothetical protein